MKNTVLSLFVAFLIFSCKTSRTGDPVALYPPSTKIFLSSINLPDSNSLSGRFRLYWSGESANGYIRGFEIASDTLACNSSAENENRLKWTFTPNTDSSFLFPIKKNETYADISFYARAIDDRYVKDPLPPCLAIPIKNARPVIELAKPYAASTRVLNDTVQSVFTLSWQATDDDGFANIDSVYIKVNQSEWIGFSRNVSLVTIMPTDPSATDSSSIKILIGESASISKLAAAQLYMNRQNQVLVKAKDISKAFSINDSTNTFYLKRKTSDLLVIDSYKIASTVDGNYVKSNLDKVYAAKGYDWYDMNKGADAYLPKYWNLTFLEMLKLYKKVLWYSNNATYGGSQALELGGNAIQNYLNTGGHIFISQSLLSTDINSPYYLFSPADSIYKNTVPVAQIDSNQVKLATPNTSLGMAFTNLHYGVATFSPVTPFYVKATANALFTSQFNTNTGVPWPGPTTLAALSKNSAGKTNQVFLAAPFLIFKNDDGMKNLFDQVLNQLFEE